MSILDGLSKKVSETGQKTLQKTREMSDVVHMNSLITEEEKRVSNLYNQIGKLYVTIYENDYKDEFTEMVNQVHESEQKIRQYTQQIQNIKGIQRCEKCNAEIVRGAVFCGSCGAPIPSPVISSMVQNNVQERICKVCGARQRKDSNFCTECGVNLNAD